jgi:hypothetical protein
VGCQCSSDICAAVLESTAAYVHLRQQPTLLCDIGGYIINGSLEALRYCMTGNTDVNIHTVHVVHGVYTNSVIDESTKRTLESLMLVTIYIEKSLDCSVISNATMMSCIRPACPHSVGAPMFASDKYVSVLITNFVTCDIPQYRVIQAKLKYITLTRRVLSAFMGGRRCYGCVSLIAMLLGNSAMDDVSKYEQCYDIKDVVDGKIGKGD